MKKVEPPPPAQVIKTQPLKPQRQTLKEPPPAREEKPRAAPRETPPIVKLPEAPSLDSRPMGLAIPEHQSKTSKEGTPGIPGAPKKEREQAPGREQVQDRELRKEPGNRPGPNI